MEIPLVLLQLLKNFSQTSKLENEKKIDAVVYIIRKITIRIFVALVSNKMKVTFFQSNKFI